MNKKIYTKIFLRAAGIDPNLENIKKYSVVWWYNFRNKKQGGLRLTEPGIAFIQNETDIKFYKINFPDNFAFTPQVIIWLDKYIESPFYIDRKSITVLKEKAAFELYLLSGDVRKYGHNKAMNQRYNQESLIN